jgi:arabinofuranosyltransferase
MPIPRSRKDELTAFSVVLIPYVILVKAFWWVDEDAFISFRYAYNFARGNGLRFNLGEPVPVEGYSNFLWTLWCGLIEFLRGDVTFWAPLTSFLAGAILLYRVFVVLHRSLSLNLWVASLATLSLAVFPPFAVWSTSGLETVPVVLVQFLVFEHLVIRHRDTWRGGLAGLTLVLLRVEGVAWAILLGLAAMLSNWLTAARTRKVPLTFFAWVIVGFMIFVAWRYSYYESLISNTALAKNIGLSLAGLERGMQYVAVYMLTFLTPLLIVPAGIIALREKVRAVGLPTLALAVAPIGYSIAVGGDYMTMGRFLVPMFPFSTLLFAWLLEWLWERDPSRKGAAFVGATVAAVIAVSLLPAVDIHLMPERIRAAVDWKAPPYLSEVEKWNVQVRHARRQSEMALALKDVAAPGDSLVTHAIGALGYYSELFIFDRSGLVNREVAALPVSQLVAPGHDKLVPSEFFLKDRPTILEAEIVPMQAVDRTVQSFAEQRQHFEAGLAAHYVTDVKPLEVAEGVTVRRRLVSNLLYPVTSWNKRAGNRVPYAIVMLRQHH